MRVFFNLRGPSGPILDKAGVDAADLEDARSQALDAIASMCAEDPSLMDEWRGWKLELVDSSDRRLATIDLSHADTIVVMRERMQTYRQTRDFA